MKEAFVVGRVVSGRSSFRVRRSILESAPGELQMKQPGDVHRTVEIDDTSTIDVVSFAPRLVEDAIGKAHIVPRLAAGDPRGAPFHRLLDSIGGDPLTLEVAFHEALAAFADASNARSDLTRAVRRAIELLRDRMTEPISLDDLAACAGIDKFRLCRDFRAQVGMPPHAYLMRLRVMRAKHLLAGGVKPGEVAPLVGFYDQSQLIRHFRKFTGTTPGKFRATGTSATQR